MKDCDEVDQSGVQWIGVSASLSLATVVACLHKSASQQRHQSQSQTRSQSRTKPTKLLHAHSLRDQLAIFQMPSLCGGMGMETGSDYSTSLEPKRSLCLCARSYRLLMIAYAGSWKPNGGIDKWPGAVGRINNASSFVPRRKAILPCKRETDRPNSCNYPKSIEKICKKAKRNHAK